MAASSRRRRGSAGTANWTSATQLPSAAKRSRRRYCCPQSQQQQQQEEEEGVEDEDGEDDEEGGWQPQRPQRHLSVHYIDTSAEIGDDEEAQAAALEQTVVLGMITRRKSATEGYTMPSSTARMLICELTPGEEIVIKDRSEFLGDSVTIRFERVPPLIHTVAHDLMTGNDVVRRDTYAEFEVVKVHTLTPTQPRHGNGSNGKPLGVGCRIDPNIANLCVPYALYARLSGRLMGTWLGGGGWSVLAQSCKSCCYSPCAALGRVYTRRCTTKEKIEDLIEEFLDGKLQHVQSNRGGGSHEKSYDQSDYELMKGAYARMDVAVDDVAHQIRHFNSRKMTAKLALRRERTHESMRNSNVQAMKISVMRYLDGTSDTDADADPGYQRRQQQQQQQQQRSVAEEEGGVGGESERQPAGAVSSGSGGGRNGQNGHDVEVMAMAMTKVDDYLRSKYGGALRYQLPEETAAAQ
jgi:hypothetical protein